MIDIPKLKLTTEKAEVMYEVFAGIDAILGAISGNIVTLVTTLPSSGEDAQLIFNTTDNKLYIWANAQWQDITGTVTGGTSDASVTVVSELPASGTSGQLVIMEGILYYWSGTEWTSVINESNPIGESVFINETPANPETGDTVIDLIGGTVQTYNGATWDVEEYTPQASAITKIGFVDSLPTEAEDGTIVYNTSDGKAYIRISGVWEDYFHQITPTASGEGGIGIVTELPLEVTDGAVLYNSTDKKLYEGINGVWTQVVEPTTAAAEVADGSLTTAAFAAGLTATEIVDTLPSSGNFVGRIAYLTTDGKLYRYTASGWSSAVPTVDLTGTIGATQIADNAISSQHISANSITADMIQANSITAEMLTADALAVGTVSAGAITATELASGAVTTDKLYAGAVTATKIASNSIDATKIVAGSISGDRISANAISAGHIQTGAVTASEISASAITSDKIASNAITSTKISAGAVGATQISANAITADKIATGSITATKLSVDALDGKSCAFSGSRAYEGGYSWCIAASNTSSGGGIHGQGTVYGVVGTSVATGVYGYSTGGNAGVRGMSSQWGMEGLTTRSDGQWGVATNQKMYAAQGFAPFTGSHIVYTKESLQKGMVVSSDDAWTLNIDQTLIHISKANEKDKRVVGVVSCTKTTLLDNIENNPMIKDEHQPYIDYMASNNFREVEINSVGEGGILVSNENGNIDNGDYLTSDGQGYAMKQDDDLLHNYTVAKALESVDWSQESSTTKMIACTYHCG